VVAILMVLLTNGFQPLNYQKKFQRDCAAKMFRINRILNAPDNSTLAGLIQGNGESIASYPRFLQLFNEDIPVCPLLETKASESDHYSVIKASDSLEVRCFFHGTRTDYEAGKEIILTEQQLRLVEQMAGKHRLSFFGSVLLINFFVAAILWLPALLLYSKPGKFASSFRDTLKMHGAVLKVMLIAILPAILLVSTNDDEAIIVITVGFTLVSFVVAKAFEMSYLPPGP
ncbi:MAG: hypothetical protein PHD82_01340, partial [Candidatus Riflebacteria bacterium]|nr:hypothetical protein [Candidatus Riflebacteria bacterium]